MREEDLLPKIKKTISSYMKDEKGSISKHKLVAMGAFLATVSAMNLAPSAADSASHQNAFDIDWEDGTMYPEHAHHVSTIL